MIELNTSLSLIGWLKEKILNETAQEPSSLEIEITKFLKFLVSKIYSKSKTYSFQSGIQEFVSQPLDKQVKNLPAFYLAFEQYLTEIEQYKGYTERSLRNLVKNRFPTITQLDNCHIIFAERQWQEVFLARMFLLVVIENAYRILGANGQNYLPKIHKWLLKAPHNTTLPLSFTSITVMPSAPSDWLECLIKISEKVYLDIEKRFGEKFALKIYGKVYKQIKMNYRGLRNFPVVIHLLPDRLLDGEKINMLSKQHVMRFLVDKVDSLQDRNDEIARKNLELSKEKKNLQEANEKVVLQMKEIQRQGDEIKKNNKRIESAVNELARQKALVTLEHKKLEQAQTIIKGKNKELLEANQLLEEKVQLRTRELEEINHHLIAANDELDNFIYRSSHDLLGPISSILGLCNLAYMENDLEQVIACYQQVEGPAKNMYAMLKRLIDIQEIKHRKIDRQPLVLLDVVKRAFDSTENPTGVKLHMNIASTIDLRSDGFLLEKLLSNMLENSIRYRDYTKEDCWIEVQANPENNDRIVITIKDNGIGVPEDLKERIFDIFFRATEKSHGPGLGLYISKVIAKLLRGKIEFIASKQHITTFKITLPA